MRGENRGQQGAFSYVSMEERIPADHPIRRIRALVDEVLKRLSGEFDQLYSRTGRPSIAPEKLLRAMLLQLLYSVRSERQLMERADYDLLFRWFIGLEIDDPIWDPSTFSKNRERLLEGDVARKFLAEVVEFARRRDLLSDEHFTVDGTLLEACASVKSFRPKDGGGEPPSGPGGVWGEFKGEKRSNETHRSTSDPDARLYRKSKHKEPKLAYLGHVLMDNRSNLVVASMATYADGYGERAAAKAMMGRVRAKGRPTLAADKAYDTRDMVEATGELGFEPHIARKTPYQTSVPKRLLRTARYKKSQACRKHIEHIYGWIKATGRLAKLRHRGLRRVDWIFQFAAGAYDLVRLARLAPSLP